MHTSDIRELDVSLRAFRSDHTLVTEEQFFGALAARESVEVKEVEPSEQQFQCARIVFVAVRASEPALSTTRLKEHVTASLEAMAAWLKRIDPATFQKLRLTGLEIDIYVDIGFEGDGYSWLSLPASLLLEAGRRELRIESNAHDFKIDLE